MEYESVLGRIDAAVDRGEQLDEIDEHIITPSNFDEGSKAALWLYAFSRTSRPQQRRFVRQQFAIIGA